MDQIKEIKEAERSLEGGGGAVKVENENKKGFLFSFQDSTLSVAVDCEREGPKVQGGEIKSNCGIYHIIYGFPLSNDHQSANRTA